MKKLLIFTSLSLVLAGCSAQEAKTKPNPFKDEITTSTASSKGSVSKSLSTTQETVGAFDEVLKNPEKYMNDGNNTVDDTHLEYKNIRYHIKKADKEYLLLSGEQYVKGTEASSGLRAVKLFVYNPEAGKVEKVAISGFPIQSLLVGDSSKAGAFNKALREKNPNIMPRAMKGKLVQNTDGEFAYINESIGGERYSVKIINGKVNLEKVGGTALPGDENDLVESGEKELMWTPVSSETKESATTTSGSSSKGKTQFSQYVGTYRGENGSVTLNEDGSITEGNQTHKPMKVTTENGRIVIESDLTVATVPVLLYIYPAGVKDSMSGDTSKNRIMKDSPKGAAYLFTKE